MKRGKLIVIEGTDGSGKATQSKMLVERFCLEDIPCRHISFPRYDTPPGNLIKRYLGKGSYEQEFGSSDKVHPKIASTWYAFDRFFAKPEMKHILDSRINLVVDRYVESNMAHQGGKIKSRINREKFFKWVDELEYGNFQIPRPDVVLFLYVPTNVAVEMRNRRESKTGEVADGHESNLCHLSRAEQVYLELAEMYNWLRIDCAPNNQMRSIEDIHEEVYSKVLGRL